MYLEDSDSNMLANMRLVVDTLTLIQGNHHTQQYIQ